MVEVAFKSNDDGVVEGLHTVDIAHSIVATGADASSGSFAGAVQIELTVRASPNRLTQQHQAEDACTITHDIPLHVHSFIYFCISLDLLFLLQDANMYDAGMVVSDPATFQKLDSMSVKEGVSSLVSGPRVIVGWESYVARIGAFLITFAEVLVCVPSTQFPVSLAAPSDQEVTLVVSPEDAQRLRLSTSSITFPAGEVGPKVT